jgi:hypothetical protein
MDTLPFGRRGNSAVYYRFFRVLRNIIYYIVSGWNNTGGIPEGTEEKKENTEKSVKDLFFFKDCGKQE